jgi:hypothetical protein
MIEWLGYTDDRWFVAVDPGKAPLGICATCKLLRGIGYIYCEQPAKHIFICIFCAPPPRDALVRHRVASHAWARLEEIQAELATKPPAVT